MNTKQYFAKYLPVEGEIKEGDYFLNGQKKLSLATKDTWLKISTEEQAWSTTHWQKVKLFLCSRDIQVGDKVRSLEFLDDTDEYEVTENTLNFLKKKGFKVIGEISPKATWVKERDEFDGDDILLDFYWEKEDKEPYMILTTLSFKTWPYKLQTPICRIKGPCGYFH